MNDARILVVEDDAEMRQLLVDELESAGCSVLGAADAAEALVLLRARRSTRLSPT